MLAGTRNSRIRRMLSLRSASTTRPKRTRSTRRACPRTHRNMSFRLPCRRGPGCSGADWRGKLLVASALEAAVAFLYPLRRTCNPVRSIASLCFTFRGDDVHATVFTNVVPETVPPPSTYQSHPQPLYEYQSPSTGALPSSGQPPVHGQPTTQSGPLPLQSAPPAEATPIPAASQSAGSAVAFDYRRPDQAISYNPGQGLQAIQDGSAGGTVAGDAVLGAGSTTAQQEDGPGSVVRAATGRRAAVPCIVVCSLLSRKSPTSASSLWTASMR